MPFIQRTIEPKFLSRGSIFNEDGTAKLTGQELEAVSNSTLCNALKQLASLTVVAEEIFKELGGQLKLVFQRCENVKNRIAFIEDKVEKFDPKKVTVPVGDICSFAQTKEHYVAKHPMDSNLFGIETRPDTLKALYEAAAKTPVHVMRQLDRWRRDGHRSSRFFVCTPVLGARRRRIRGKVDIDIETRMPAVVEDLRRWTSDEALGDVTVYPNNCATRISSASVALSDGEQTDGTIISDDEAIDHKLPSPEEQLQVVALKFPAEVVCVDITGRSFDRMSMQRRSLTTGEVSNNRTMDGETTVRRRGRTRRPRNRRRNTLAGTDQKEIQNALIAGDESSTVDAADATKRETQTTVPSTVPRSKSSDLLRSISTRNNNNNNNKESAEIKISRFNSLKQWGKSQYEKLRLNNNNNKSSENKNESIINNNNNSSSNKSRISSSEDGLDDFNLYETVTMKRRRDLSKERISNKTHHERNPSISSSEKSIAVNGNTNNNNAMTSVINFAVKLRDSSLQRRQRRQGSASGNNRDQEPHSSSGNWSASSESGRASIGSEITSTTTTHPKSSTSAATSNNSLNHPPSSVNSKRRFNFNTNTTTTISTTSGSVTSEGSTLTPDIIHDLHEDGDSVYSCDTEGYYTSFHMDSGLKTLKEEDLPSTPLQSTSAFSNSAGSNNNNNNTTAENEYELFGKGSTSTTTSSAGTVCTTLRAADSNRSLIIIGPSVPERKSSLSKLSTKSAESSLERMNNNKNDTIKRSPGLNNNSSNKPTVVAVIHKNNNGDISPDSGHNTSSSPIESVSSPMNDDGVRSRAGSDFEFSESSDMEGAERIERIRIKTTCNSSRIPSMCAITPSQSDDDDNSSNSTSSAYKKQIEVNNLKNNNNINGNLGYDDDDDGMNKKVSIINRNIETGYVTVEQLLDQPDGIIKISSNNNNLIRAPSPSGGSVTVIKQESAAAKSSIHQPIIKSSLMPFNQMLGKLKNNISNFTNNNKKDLHNNKRSSIENPSSAEDDLLGEYVTLADVRNNNDSNTYVNDVINRNLKTVLSGKIRDAEYVSLNELPIIKDNNNAIISTTADSLERKHRQGARVMLDAEGKVVYSSDSLKRRKTPTTFEPGPFVKQITAANNDASSSPQMLMRVSKPIRSVTNHQDQKMKLNVPQTEFNRPLSPTYSSTGNKVIIKASGTQPEIVRNPASVVLQPVSPKMRPLSPKGAYVHVVHHQSSTTGGSSSSSSSLLSPKKLREGVINTAPLQNLIENPHQELQFLEPSQKPLMYGPAENNDPYFYPQSNYLHQHKKEVNFYSTLPSKRTPSSYFSYDNIPPERSVTPDITRGLVDRTKSGSTGTFFKSADQNLLTMGHKIGIPVKMPQINIGQNKINIDDSLKISPIDPRNTGGGGFKSSTPSQIIKKAAENLDSKLLLSPNKRSTMSNEELYAVIHKTKKKLDIQKGDFSKIAPLIEPSIKPSSSNRKSEIETGYIGSRQSWSSPSKGEYVDFNADIDKVSPINNNEPKNRQSWAACNDRKGGVKKTSALDFKRLLLQKSSTTITSGNTKKLSAVEQLKISKEQMLKQNKEGTLNPSNNNKKPSSSSASTDMTILDFSSSPRSLLNRKLFNTVPSTPGSPERGTGSKSVPIKVLSPRSQWRFTNPRSDVLSTTILEDCREDDNSSNDASKSSLEKRINLHRTIEQSSNTVNREKIPDFPDAPSQNIVGKLNNNKQSSNKESTKYVSVTDRMSAQRAKFFGTSSSNLNNPNQENNPSKNKKMPPTLETAF